MVNKDYHRLLDNKTRWRFLFIFFTLVLTTSLRTQSPHFRNYTTADGLPSSEVYCVIEDRQGYLWFGTDNGIARFDGYDFRVYDQADGLKSLVFFTLQEGIDGKIYGLDKNNNLYAWSANSDKFTLSPHNEALQQYLNSPGYYAKLIGCEPDGSLRIIAAFRGLFKISPQGEFTTIQDTTSLDRISIAGTYGIDLYASYAPNMIGLYERPFFYERDAFIINHFTENGSLLRKDTFYGHMEKGIANVSALTFDSKNDNYNFVVVTSDTLHWSSGIEEAFQTKQYDHHDYLFRTNYKDKMGGFYLCLVNKKGIVYYPDFQHFISHEPKYVLSGVDASWVTEDRRGGLWITTLDQGIFYASNPNSILVGPTEGVEKVQVLEIVPGGDVFASANGLPLYHLQHDEDLTYRVLTYPSILKTVNKQLYYHQYSQQLFGANFAFDLVRGTTKRYDYQDIYANNYNKPNSLVSSAFYGRNNDSILVTGSAGILQLSANELTVNFVYNNRKEFDAEIVSTILNTRDILPLDGGNHYVLASSNGLSIYTDGQFKSVNFGFPQLDNYISGMAFLPDSSLLFATRGSGLHWLKDSTLITIDETTGLVDNGIRHLHLDEYGTAWASTFKGVSKINFYDCDGLPIRKNGIKTNVEARLSLTGQDTSQQGYFKFRNFTTAHGLPTNEVYQTKSRDGTVWLATGQGLYRLEEPPVDTLAIQPIIQQFFVGDSLYNIDAANDELLALAPDQNSVRITYLAIDPRQDGQINYRYRLYPTNEWTITDQRRVNFASISPGLCYFEVQHQNADGIWSDSTKLSFEVDQYWYKKAWVLFVLSLLVLAAVIAFFLTQQRRLKRDAKLQQQLTDLERSALQAQMNPHFIFNCLNSINQFILENEGDQASMYLSRFARLIRQTLNISVAGHHALIDEIGMLTNYLELEKMRFKEQFSYQIEVSPELDQMDIFLPPLLVQPFVENALLHGLNNRPYHGEVSVDFSPIAKGLKVTIEDNGRGIDTSQQKTKKQSSLGMTVTKKRLEILAQQNERSVIDVIALEDDNGNPRGTRVEICISLGTTVL